MKRIKWNFFFFIFTVRNRRWSKVSQVSIDGWKWPEKKIEIGFRGWQSLVTIGLRSVIVRNGKQLNFHLSRRTDLFRISPDSPAPCVSSISYAADIYSRQSTDLYYFLISSNVQYPTVATTWNFSLEFRNRVSGQLIVRVVFSRLMRLLVALFSLFTISYSFRSSFTILRILGPNHRVKLC